MASIDSMQFFFFLSWQTLFPKRSAASKPKLAKEIFFFFYFLSKWDVKKTDLREIKNGFRDVMTLNICFLTILLLCKCCNGFPRMFQASQVSSHDKRLAR